jgi:hypothetical protein
VLQRSSYEVVGQLCEVGTTVIIPRRSFQLIAWGSYGLRDSLFAAGGLFLAFPAIFCASATLIEKHERERKEEKGLQGKERGQDAAVLDAAGAGLGSVARRIRRSHVVFSK